MHGLSETDAAPAALPEAPPETSSEAGERPMLFLHLGNTALLPALRGRFGDDRVLCLDDAGPRLRDTVDDLVANRLGALSCVAGDLPVHYFAPHLERFRPFTELHHPIARVFSLYHRLRRAPDVELETMRLHREFDFETFIGSRTPALYRLVNNPMCRMLCGEPRLSDPDSTEYWRIDPDPALAERALAALRKFDFELAEVPEHEGRATVDHLQMVIRRNTLDLALYQRAAELCRAREHAAELGIGADGQAVFAPVLDQVTDVADIPGRQGFEPVAETEVGWLLPDRPARIFFRAPEGVARIALEFCSLATDYPIDQIVVTVNGDRVSQSTHRSDPHWFTLQATPGHLRAELNVLAIDPPMFLSVREETSEQRYLSVALASIAFLR